MMVRKHILRWQSSLFIAALFALSPLGATGCSKGDKCPENGRFDNGTLAFHCPGNWYVKSPAADTLRLKVDQTIIFVFLAPVLDCRATANDLIDDLIKTSDGRIVPLSLTTTEATYAVLGAERRAARRMVEINQDHYVFDSLRVCGIQNKMGDVLASLDVMVQTPASEMQDHIGETHEIVRSISITSDFWRQPNDVDQPRTE